MSSCKIVSFESSQRSLTLEVAAIPELKEQEILVRNEYTTLCRSDIYTYSGMRKEKILPFWVMKSLAGLKHLVQVHPLLT